MPRFASRPLAAALFLLPSLAACAVILSDQGRFSDVQKHLMRSEATDEGQMASLMEVDDSKVVKKRGNGNGRNRVGNEPGSHNRELGHGSHGQAHGRPGRDSGSHDFGGHVSKAELLPWAVNATFVFEGLSPQLLLSHPILRHEVFVKVKEVLDHHLTDWLRPGNDGHDFREFAVDGTFDSTGQRVHDPKDVHIYVHARVRDEHVANHVLSWFKEEAHDIAGEVLSELKSDAKVMVHFDEHVSAQCFVRNAVSNLADGSSTTASGSTYSASASMGSAGKHERTLSMTIIVEHLTLDANETCTKKAYRDAVHDAVHLVVGQHKSLAFTHKEQGGGMVSSFTLVAGSAEQAEQYKTDLTLGKEHIESQVHQELIAGIRACGDFSTELESIKVIARAPQVVKSDQEIHDELDVTVVLNLTNVNESQASMLSDDHRINKKYTAFLAQTIFERVESHARSFTYFSGDGRAQTFVKMEGNSFADSIDLYRNAKENKLKIASEVESWLVTELGAASQGHIGAEVVEVQPPEEASDIPHHRHDPGVDVPHVDVTIEITGLTPHQKESLLSSPATKQVFEEQLQRIVAFESGGASEIGDHVHVRAHRWHFGRLETTCEMAPPSKVHLTDAAAVIAQRRTLISDEVERFIDATLHPAAEQNLEVYVKSVTLPEMDFMWTVTLIMSVSNVSWPDLMSNRTLMMNFDDSILSGVQRHFSADYVYSHATVKNHESRGRGESDRESVVLVKIEWYTFTEEESKALLRNLEVEEAQICKSVTEAIKEGGSRHLSFFNLPLGHLSTLFHETPTIGMVNPSVENLKPAILGSHSSPPTRVEAAAAIALSGADGGGDAKKSEELRIRSVQAQRMPKMVLATVTFFLMIAGVFALASFARAPAVEALFESFDSKVAEDIVVRRVVYRFAAALGITTHRPENGEAAPRPRHRPLEDSRLSGLGAAAGAGESRPREDEQ